MGLPDVYERIKPAVVAIALVEERGTKTNFRIFGSGFCVDSSGIIVTARHVVTRYYEDILKAPLPRSHREARVPIQKPGFQVVFFRKESDRYGSIFASPMNYILPLEGDAPEDDVAALRMPSCPDIWGTGYPYLELGDLSRVREGDEIATSGYPLRWDLSGSRLPDLSKGIISRVDEKLGSEKKWEITKLVLDIRINPGNSGGPVFETQSGSVLGLISQERVRDPAMMPNRLKGLFKIPAGIAYCIPSGIISKAISVLEYAERSSGNTP